MKIALIAAAAALVATPALASTAGQTCKATSVDKIEKQFGKFNAAWATKDPAKVAKLFSKDAVLLATVSNKERATPEGIQEYFVSFLKNSPQAVLNSSTIKLDCNTATRVGHWTVTLTDPNTGAKSDVKARYSFAYSYEDGWKIEHLHSSVLPPNS